MLRGPRTQKITHLRVLAKTLMVGVVEKKWF